MLSDPESRRKYDAFGPDFRQVPEGVDPATWARSRAYAGAAPGLGLGRGAAVVGAMAVVFGSRPRTWKVSTSRTFSAGCSVAPDARRGWGPITVPTRRRSSSSASRTPITAAGARSRWQVPRARGPSRSTSRLVSWTASDPAGRAGWSGNRGRRGGDLYLVVRIAPHPRYRLEGRDIHVDLPITPWEGALGASVPLDTPAGEATVKVPRGTSSGRRLRLRGRGLPSPEARRGTCSPRPRSWCLVT